MTPCARARPPAPPSAACGSLLVVGLLSGGCFVDSLGPLLDDEPEETDTFVPFDGTIEPGDATGGSTADATVGGDTSTGGADDPSGTSDGPDPRDTTTGAPTETYCDTLRPAAAFCADFDEPGALAVWKAPVQQGGGTVAIDELDAVSPPRSLATHVPLADGLVAAMASRAMSEVGADVSIDVHVRFDPACFVDGGPPIRALGVLYPDPLGPGTFEHQVLVYLDPDEVLLRELEPGASVDHPVAWTTGVADGWVAASLEVRPSDATLSLALDGRVVVEVPLELGPAGRRPSPVVNFGPWTNVGTTAACDTRFDDVVVR